MRVLIFFYLLPSCHCYGLMQGFLDYPGIGWLQSTCVRGWFKCNRELFDKAKVWIYDKENTKDVMLSGPAKSDLFRNSEYLIKGTTREVTKIEPYLYVEHWCNRKKNQTPVHSCLDIPSQYVSYGSRPKRCWYVDIELSKKMKDKEIAKFSQKGRSC